MSAERLREAAALIRSRAQGALDVRGSGDWFIETAWCDLTGSSYAVKSSGGTLSHGSCEEEAVHFASWSPAVAVAVADSLDQSAAVIEEAGSGPLAMAMRAIAEPLVAVADAYLGAPA